MSIVKPHRIGGLIGSIPSTVSGVYGLTKLSEINFPFAIGGDTYTYAQDGKYWRCHMFSQVGSDTLTFLRGGLVEYLVVGGGGAGGGQVGGGGGAGGVRSGTIFGLTSGTASITVGDKGNGSSNALGANGSDSAFDGITSTGGGGGGTSAAGGTTTGSNGGSGGGGSGFGGAGGTGNTPSTIPSQGNDGGDGSSSLPNYGAGAGGGASGVGGNGAATGFATGGSGASSSISGSSITYGAGGSGGVFNAIGNTNGVDGLPFTGNGGGGASASGGGVTSGGSGGSGIVIVRYQITQAEYEGDEPYYDNVSLLLHMNGANGSTTFTDSSKHRHAVTANGNAQVSTAQSKFGGASAAFDGTGDYLTTTAVADWIGELGTDFTVECWVHVNSWPTAGASLVAKGTSGETGGTDKFSLEVRTSSVHAYLSGDYSGAEITATGLSLSTWHHVALTRSGNDFRVFIDGVQSGSTYTNASNISSFGTLFIGTNQYDPGAAARTLNGYIDDLRITKGVARYTGNFTPPQRELLP